MALAEDAVLSSSAVHASDDAATVKRRKKASRVVQSHDEDPEVEEVIEGEHADEGDGIGVIIIVLIIVLLIAGFFYFLYTQVISGDMDPLTRRLNQGPKVDAKHLQLEVDLAQLYTGYSTQVPIERQMVCRHCAGSGVDLKAGFHSCHECDGTGVRTFVQQIGGMKQYVRSHCGKCKGRGKVANHECDHCHGKGVFRESKHLDVHVEKGMHHDDTVTLRLEGDQVPQAMPGDVVVHVKVKPHDVFRRRQDDLEMTLDISLLEALVGFDRQVTHLDGHAVRLHRTELVQPESVWRIAREGMPVRGTSRQYGDLLVYFNIGYPRALNATEKHLVSQFLAE